MQEGENPFGTQLLDKFVLKKSYWHCVYFLNSLLLGISSQLYVKDIYEFKAIIKNANIGLGLFNQFRQRDSTVCTNELGIYFK